MERLFNNISSIFFDKKLDNSIRYPLIIIILSLYVIATFVFFNTGVILFEDNTLLSLVYFLLGFFFFLGSIIKIKNNYFARNNVK